MNNSENGDAATTPSDQTTVNVTAATPETPQQSSVPSQPEVDLAYISYQLDNIHTQLKHINRRDNFRLWFAILHALVPLGIMYLIFYFSQGIIQSVTEQFGTIFQFAIPGSDQLQYNLEIPEEINLDTLPQWAKDLLP